MSTFNTGVENSGCLIRRTGLSLLVVGPPASTLFAHHFSDWQLLSLLVLLHYFQSTILGIAHHHPLCLGQRIEVATELAEETIALGGAFDQQQLKAEWTKFH